MQIEDNLKEIFDAAPVAMILSRPDGSFEYVNAALLDMLGYTREEIYEKKVIISHPDDIHINVEIRKKLKENPFTPIVIEKRYIDKSGRVIEGLLTLAAQPDKQGNVQRCIAQIIDLTKQKQVENSLKLFNKLVQNSNDSIFIIDAESSNFVEVNDTAADRLGYDKQSLLKLGVLDIEAVIPDHFSWKTHVADLKQVGRLIIEGRHKRKDESTFPVEVSISYVEANDSNYVIAVARDITERHQSQELLWKQANFDNLTGLPNRSMLNGRLLEILKYANRTQQKVSVLALDLDGFKEVNDSYGHDIGDKLLIKAAQRIKNTVRETDIVARMGGDEFIVVLKNMENSFTTEHVTNSILEAMRAPFYINEYEFYITTSIGVAVFPRDGDNVETLMMHSDQAMYQAKKHSKNCCRYFSHTMQEQAERHLLLSTELRKGLKYKQFSVNFQPIIDAKTGEILSAEALVRWHHPELGSVSPTEFIPIAEANGTIEDIGHWVLTSAIVLINQLKKYREEITISVNTSPVQFRKGKDIFYKWKMLLEEFKLKGGAVKMEITEGTVMDDTLVGVHESLLMLRDLGIQVALDDFGTGYSSLSYLKKLDIDYLKIDRSFVHKMTKESDDLALCEAIVEMAHKLNLEVVAEGIETQEQWEILKSLGCDYGQGYYFAKPVSDVEFTQLIKDNKTYC